MRLAMIGLGRMGWGMASRLLRTGHEVVAYNRSPEKTRQLADQEGALPAESLAEVVSRLKAPRVVWLMLPSGQVVDAHVLEFLDLLDAGDILIDGGNSQFTDAPRRHDAAKARGVSYLDVGVSGGVWGLEEGFCLMIGGPRDAYEQVEPALKSLAPANGYLFCGQSGAGHFVKMVHNAIEYALMQAYAEGFSLLEHSPYSGSLDFAEVCRMWNNGSVIRSWLLELAGRAFAEDPRLDALKPWVDDSGEGRWAVHQAVEAAVPAPVITLALMERFRSRDKNSFADRLLAALRNQFGGHAIKKNA
ncbi:decarboxylating 6-phosphogluconate dehydrogenase [Desulfocurvibacter africanus]|uniref:phosphogluconate dehydrogenase (NAD(+)-dependent, decarboxylating) n=1 Tax=Desulfocurvibacter africanus TaxID=873 RepID=UPI002FDB4592